MLGPTGSIPAGTPLGHDDQGDEAEKASSQKTPRVRVKLSIDPPARQGKSHEGEHQVPPQRTPAHASGQSTSGAVLPVIRRLASGLWFVSTHL